MKKGIHPENYRPVVFQDTNTGTTFLTRSTAKTGETIKLGGKEYPLVKVHISSASHPFYTGEEKIVDVEGRVDRFKAQQAAAKMRRQKHAKKAKKSAAKAKETAKKPQNNAKNTPKDADKGNPEAAKAAA